MLTAEQITHLLQAFFCLVCLVVICASDDGDPRIHL
jgi:hypothetical protein